MKKYANGREAKQGDKVVHIATGFSGYLYDDPILEKETGYSSRIVPFGTGGLVKESECLHVEDIHAETEAKHMSEKTTKSKVEDAVFLLVDSIDGFGIQLEILSKKTTDVRQFKPLESNPCWENGHKSDLSLADQIETQARRVSGMVDALRMINSELKC